VSGAQLSCTFSKSHGDSSAPTMAEDLAEILLVLLADAEALNMYVMLIGRQTSNRVVCTLARRGTRSSCSQCGALGLLSKVCSLERWMCSCLALLAESDGILSSIFTRWNAARHFGSCGSHVDPCAACRPRIVVCWSAACWSATSCSVDWWATLSPAMSRTSTVVECLFTLRREMSLSDTSSQV
jgi:hypothetical protein